MTTTLLVSTFHPFPSLVLSVPSDTPLSEVASYFPDYLTSIDADLSLTLPSGILPPPSTSISTIYSDCLSSCEATVSHSPRLVSMRLVPRLRGGKGGFGSQLRAAGGRMSSQKTSNNDSCRDLNGRRLSTIKEAKALATYLESEPERKKAQQEAQRAKLQALERKLGIDSKSKGKEKEETSSGVKRRFDDTEYIEQSKDIVDNVRSAVTAAMLKKKKKAKVTPSEKEDASSKSPDGQLKEDSTSTPKLSEVVEKVVESPVTATVAATAASLAAVGA